MLIKIRNTLIDPEEVQTVTPDRNEERAGTHRIQRRLQLLDRRDHGRG